MRSTTSPQIFKGVDSSRSIVRPTAPSVEFSTGTTGIVGVTGLDLAEHIIDCRLRQQARGMTEMLGCRRLREGAERPEEGNAQRFFERQAGRHHLAKEEGDVFAGQRAGIGFLQATQHLGFALRAIDVPGLAVFGLDLADLLRTTRPLVEEPEQFAVDTVDIGAHAGQCLLQVVLCLVAHALTRCVWRNRS